MKYPHPAGFTGANDRQNHAQVFKSQSEVVTLTRRASTIFFTRSRRPDVTIKIPLRDLEEPVKGRALIGGLLGIVSLDMQEKIRKAALKLVEEERVEVQLESR